jgi:hypothetical protein
MMTDEAIENLASIIMSQSNKDDIDAFLGKVDFSQYQDDPVGFCEKVLGETLTDDVKAMLESVRDNVVTVAISANATGKTHGAARAAIWFYLCCPKVKVFTAAAPPLDNLKNLLWGEINSVVESHEELFKGHDRSFLDIRRGPEDYLIGVAIPSSSTDKEARFSGKHRPYMLFVFDEGDAIPDEVYRGTDSCMSGHVRLLIMFNPRKSSGAVYRMIKNKEANIVHLSALCHPNVISGNNLVDGAVTRDVTVDRINRWSRPFRDGDTESARSVFTLPDYLVGVTAPRKNGTIWPLLEPGKYKIINPALSYMVLGQYPAQGTDQLISEEWVSAARARYDLYTSKHGDTPPVGATGVMGLDVAEMGDDSNVAVGRYGGYLTQFALWGGVDTLVTGDRAAAWYRAHKGISRANVDATGVGAGVAPHMQRLWRVREWLRTDPGAMLPPEEELIEELMALTYDTDSGKVEVLETKELKRVLGRSPDRLMSLTMTFAGAGGFFQDCDFQDFPDG